ncbi:MAG: serine/threonine protein kinase [Deltaproteobacteria bacterium]|nr:serine/threonine protein kinase [Deltaproteobacteria bacterium]
MKIPKELRWERTEKTLGEGGQAQVFLVKDKDGEFDGVWALKALKRGEPSQAYERFSREVSAIKKLEHPNIIRIIDSSSPSDTFQFYVMEYIDGTLPLEKIIKNKFNPYYGNSLKSLSLFEQICSALVACENCSPKIIHRDLSPANILVKLEDLTIKVIDFGLCQLQGHETITLIDEGVGTVNYMAPECESGSDDLIGVGADLYSAGKIMWSAITGLKAFSRENPVFKAKSMTKMFPDNPKTWHLHHIFEKTVRHDWRNRWGTGTLAESAAKQVRFIIESGYPPLEEIGPRCPICGVGELSEFSGSHNVFGNPNPRGIVALQCTYCGICFAKNSLKRKEILDTRKNLD